MNKSRMFVRKYIPFIILNKMYIRIYMKIMFKIVFKITFYFILVFLFVGRRLDTRFLFAKKLSGKLVILFFC